MRWCTFVIVGLLLLALPLPAQAQSLFDFRLGYTFTFRDDGVSSHQPEATFSYKQTRALKGDPSDEGYWWGFGAKVWYRPLIGPGVGDDEGPERVIARKNTMPVHIIGISPYLGNWVLGYHTYGHDFLWPTIHIAGLLADSKKALRIDAGLHLSPGEGPFLSLEGFTQIGDDNSESYGGKFTIAGYKMAASFSTIGLSDNPIFGIVAARLDLHDITGIGDLIQIYLGVSYGFLIDGNLGEDTGGIASVFETPLHGFSFYINLDVYKCFTW